MVNKSEYWISYDAIKCKGPAAGYDPRTLDLVKGWS